MNHVRGLGAHSCLRGNGRRGANTLPRHLQAPVPGTLPLHSGPGLLSLLDVTQQRGHAEAFLHSWRWWLPRGGSGWAEKERAAPCTPAPRTPAPRPVKSPEGLKEGQAVGLVPGFQTHPGACWGPFRRGRMAARRRPELGRPGPPHSSGDRNAGGQAFSETFPPSWTCSLER